MKINPFVTGLLACGVAAFSASAAGHIAPVLNIDFDSDSGSVPSVTYSGQAAAPDLPGNNFWNSVKRSGSDVNDTSVKKLSDGTTETAVGISISGVGSWSNPLDQETSILTDLTTDYLSLTQNNDEWATGVSKTLNGTISGLAAGGVYDLYLYGLGDQMDGTGIGKGQNSGFTIDGVTQQTSWDLVPGGNGLLWEGFEFVLFEGVAADGDGNIAFEWFNPNTDTGDKDGNPSKWAGFNGLQIAGEFTPVPEPTTMALLGIGGLLLIQAARRRR